jgi:D-galactarolactone cycloisomerase
MSRVERLELHHVEVPLPTAFYPSWIPGYPQTQVKFDLLRIVTDDGLVGHSAGNAFSTERRGLGDLLGGFLVGLEADDIDTVRRRLREASYLGWRNWWVECAFWDLKGKKLGKPVYQLLQDEEKVVERVKVYASTGEVRTFAHRASYLHKIRELGIDAVKLRVHDPAMRNDIEIVKAVRRFMGPDFIIGVDANQGWPVSLIQNSPIWDLDYATRFGKACDELNVAWLEEPLDMHDWAGMAALRKAVKTPISGGELHGGWHEFAPLFEQGCLDKYQPDATFCGLTVSKRVMDRCRAEGLQFTPHTWTNGIGFVINMHAFAAWGGEGRLEWPFEPPAFVPEVRGGIIPPIWPDKDGAVAVPQEPGLGLHIDEKLLRKFGERVFVTSPLRVAVKTVREKGLMKAIELQRKKEKG